MTKDGEDLDPRLLALARALGRLQADLDIRMAAAADRTDDDLHDGRHENHGGGPTTPRRIEPESNDPSSKTKPNPLQDPYCA